MLVGRHVAGDRQHPGAQVVARRGASDRPGGRGGTSPGTRPRRAGGRAASRRTPKHDAAMLLVEPLERWHRHGPHHPYKRAGASRCETAAMRVAVVGHVEWVEFLRVPHVPTAGEIVHATDAWDEPAGGGAVAAVQLASWPGRRTSSRRSATTSWAAARTRSSRRWACELHVAWRDAPQRRAVTFVDEPRRADDHRDRRPARAPRRRSAALGRAGRGGRRLLHRRRRRRAAGGSRGAGPDGDAADDGHAARSARRARRPRRQRPRRGGDATSRASSTRRRASTSRRAGAEGGTMAPGGPLRRAPRSRDRSSTPTAPATRSPPGSPTGSAAGMCPRRRGRARRPLRSRRAHRAGRVRGPAAV